MSRLTPIEVTDLMEAYNTVYAPQELTEEQIWEEVEDWVNSLLEEGYDLSEYTWEEMYESYLIEMGQTRTTGQNSNVFTLKTTPGQGSAGAGGGGRRGGGSSPGSIKPTPAAKSTSAAPYKSKFAGARDAAFQKAQGIKGSPVVGSRPSAAPAARPSAAAARPSAAAARPSASAPAAPKVAPKPATTPSGGNTLSQATAAASKPPAFSPKPQSDVGAMIARSQARQAAQAPKPSTPTPAAKPTPRQARLNMEMEYDTFDAILEHLVAEGYADTNESALAIMANMSEEWRESIVEAQVANRDPDAYEEGERKKETSGQRSERKVRGRLATMDPEKRKKMIAQMRAVGLDV